MFVMPSNVYKCNFQSSFNTYLQLFPVLFIPHTKNNFVMESLIVAKLQDCDLDQLESCLWMLCGVTKA